MRFVSTEKSWNALNSLPCKTLGPAKKADLFAVLKDALPDVLTEEQKSKKLSNLLQKMKKDGLVDVRGIAVNSEWYIKTKD